MPRGVWQGDLWFTVHCEGASTINIRVNWLSKTTIGSVIALLYRLKSNQPEVSGYFRLSGVTQPSRQE